jgi:hypothetical protein
MRLQHYCTLHYKLRVQVTSNLLFPIVYCLLPIAYCSLQSYEYGMSHCQLRGHVASRLTRPMVGQTKSIDVNRMFQITTPTAQHSTSTQPHIPFRLIIFLSDSTRTYLEGD